MRRYLLVTFILLAFSLHLIPGAHAETVKPKPLPNAQVGKVDGTNAFVGVSRRGDAIRAYVCDGTPKREATISQWFRGTGHTLEAGGHTLALHGRHGSFDGHPFTLREARTPAGLFQHKGDPVNASWIVLPDLRLRGTMVETRPRKCRFVMVTDSSGSHWVAVCG